MEELTQILSMVKEGGALGVLAFVLFLAYKERTRTKGPKE